MNINQFIHADKKKVILSAFFIVTAIFSFIFFQLYKTRVYPLIGIDVKINRQEAQKKAEDFLKEKGVAVERYKKVTEFFNFSNTENYLDKNLGSKQAGFLLNSEINDWNFETRFFIPTIQEEYRVSFDNLGRFASYYFALPDDKEGAKIIESQAQVIAEDFIKQYYYDDLAGYKIAESDSNDRGKRLDYDFVWEKSQFDIKGAKKRIGITVSGDQVTDFYEYLKIPDEWSRNEASTYAKNETAQTVAEVLVGLFIYIPMMIIFVRNFKKRLFNYKFAWKIALATIFIALLLLIDSITTIYSGYSTLDTWSNFIASQIFYNLLAILLAGLGPWLLILVSESYFRSNNPDKPALNNLLSREFFIDAKYTKALFYGFLSGFIVIAYQLVYYFVVQKFKFWVPSDVIVNHAFSGLIPWVNILVIGLLAAISEEFTFRLFGITFLNKILKKTWLAVLVSSLLWSFLHSAYPQQPFFARGLELLPVGIAFSFLYLRYGIIASITAHFTMNSLLALQYLLKAGYLNGLIAILIFFIPLLIVLYSVWWRRRHLMIEPAVIISNADFSSGPTRQKTEKVVRPIKLLFYEILSKKLKFFLAAIFVAGILATAYMLTLTDNSFLPEPDKSIPRTEIIHLSDNYLQAKGVDPQQYKKVADFFQNFSDEDKAYLLDQTGGKGKLKAIYSQKIPAYLWTVRYFKPMEKESYYVILLPDGNLYSINHIISETQKGAILSKAEGQLLAEEYLKSRNDVDLTTLELIQVIESKKPDRMDYTVIYKDKNFDLGDGSVRTDLKIRGDEVGYFSRYIYIPEAWYRNESKSNIKDFTIGAIYAIAAIFFIFYLVFSYLQLYRGGIMRWREGYTYALPIMAISFIIAVNSLNTYYLSYGGVESLNLFHAKTILMYIFGALVGFLLLVLAFSFILALIRENVINPIFPKGRDESKRVWRDAIIIGYTTSSFLLFISAIFYTVLDFLEKKYDLYKYLIELPSSSTVNVFIPLISDIGENIMALFTLPLLFLPALVMYRYFKKWWVVMGIVYLMVLLGFILENDYKQIFIDLFFLLLSLAIIIPLGFIIKKNVLSIAVMFYFMIVFFYVDIDKISWFYDWKNLLSLIILFIPVVIYQVYFRWQFKIKAWQG